MPQQLLMALFASALGVVLGAAAIGPFEVVVVLPSLVAAAALVLVAFALAARRGLGRELEAVVVADPAHHAGEDAGEREQVAREEEG